MNSEISASTSGRRRQPQGSRKERWCGRSSVFRAGGYRRGQHSVRATRRRVRVTLRHRRDAQLELGTAPRRAQFTALVRCRRGRGAGMGKQGADMP
eukprot:scaffold40696_cov43-Tisochrysis_lutea.AAC.1